MSLIENFHFLEIRDHHRQKTVQFKPESNPSECHIEKLMFFKKKEKKIFTM